MSTDTEPLCEPLSGVDGELRAGRIVSGDVRDRAAKSCESGPIFEPVAPLGLAGEDEPPSLVADDLDLAFACPARPRIPLIGYGPPPRTDVGAARKLGV